MKLHPDDSRLLIETRTDAACGREYDPVWNMPHLGQCGCTVCADQSCDRCGFVMTLEDIWELPE